MLAQEMTAEVVASSGWFLDHAWLIPIIPAVAFVLIIFFVLGLLFLWHTLRTQQREKAIV